MKKTIKNILQDHINLNLAIINALSMMILAQLESSSIQLSIMARYFDSTTKCESSFRRIQRFIKQVFLPSDKIATIMLAIFGLTAEQKLILIFDRTNWKFGKIHLNILFLSVIHNGISIPLFFHILENKKQGNSSYIDRIKLLEKFIALLGSSIKAMLGDREFAGKHFVMRISEKTTKIALENDDFINIQEIFKGLKKGRKRFLGYCFIWQTEKIHMLLIQKEFLIFYWFLD